MQSDFALAPYRHLGKVNSLSSKHEIRILMLGGQTEFAENVKDELLYEGYYIDFVKDGYSDWTAAQKSCYALVILDWTSSPISGLELCYRIRSIRKTLGIVMLMSTDKVGDRVDAFEAGADDCLLRSFERVEILARIKACMRGMLERREKVLCYSDLMLNNQTREVYRGNVFISLTPREFDLLAYFMEHRHQVLTRNQILDSVWGYDFISNSNVVEVYVRALRLKLEMNGGNRLIHTIRFIGYALRS